ncbi:MAG TPA: 6,7-dimethyl-8-ribityllumazine synthase [Chthoniobacterales bacterium]|jgi:6,7-dimethyl-8-ribityllumazine synthase
MSKALPIRPRIAAKAKNAFALVVSRYNGEFTSALEREARAELLAIDPGATIETFDAPGSFEVPLIVKLLAERRQYHAILALGIILKGETAHADLIAASITNSLQQIALSHNVPVIHEVLLVNNEAQAHARCLEPELNRGREAARAAASAVETVQAIITT